jgi:hypothetical protein
VDPGDHRTARDGDREVDTMNEYRVMRVILDIGALMSGIALMLMLMR